MGMSKTIVISLTDKDEYRSHKLRRMSMGMRRSLYQTKMGQSQLPPVENGPK